MELLGLAAAPLCFAAFVAAALSMDRHHRQVMGGPCPLDMRRRLRLISIVCFALAAAIAVVGGSVAFVAGVLGAGAAAGVVVGVLNLRPRLLRPLVRGAGER
jgi:hypothetical protein